MHHLGPAGALRRSNNNSVAGGAPFAMITFDRSMARANGIFNNKYAGTGSAIQPTGEPVRSDDIKDGLGNTVLLSENLQALPWAHTMVSLADSAAVLRTPSYPAQSRFVQGFVWHYEDPNNFNGAPSVNGSHKVNGALGTEDIFITRQNAANAQDVARPSSAHVSGVNVGFADGSSRFVTNEIDYRIYQAYMTSRGKSSDVPFREYVLKGEAL